MFGELPVDKYIFLTLATPDGYGGLEHRDSTSLICKRSDLPSPGVAKPDKGYRRYLGLCSHEYFHLWNVKRIRPARLAEADLSAEAYTELLWAFEGITSYYDELALARSGALTAEDYLDLFATTVTRVQRNPGRARQSVAASSFDAWTKFYKQDENAPNAIVSYYTKGALVAFGLDMTLREASADRISLDDLMRRLWQRYGMSGRGVPERGIEQEAASLLGAPLELPLQAWFESVGIGQCLRPANNGEDLGGYRTVVKPDQNPVPPALGVRFEEQPAGLRLLQVIAGGPAQFAGLAPGDLLVALDGERLTAANLGGLLQRMNGEPADMHYFRRDRLAVTRLPTPAAPADTCDLWLLPAEELDSTVLARRAAWLRSNHLDIA
jgi:predicted metalloprotease with PDZ domain